MSNTTTTLYIFLYKEKHTSSVVPVEKNYKISMCLQWILMKTLHILQIWHDK